MSNQEEDHSELRAALKVFDYDGDDTVLVKDLYSVFAQLGGEDGEEAVAGIKQLLLNSELAFQDRVNIDHFIEVLNRK